METRPNVAIIVNVPIIVNLLGKTAARYSILTFIIGIDKGNCIGGPWLGLYFILYMY